MAAVLLAGCAIPVQAQELAAQSPAEESADLAALNARIAELEQAEQEAQQRISQLESQLARMASLEERLSRIEAGAMDEAALGAVRGRFLPQPTVARALDPQMAFVQSQQGDGPAPGAGSAPTGMAEPEIRREPAPTEAVAEVTQQQQGRFGSRFGFEYGLGYTHFGDARINLDGFLALDAIFLGTISIDEVTADIFTFDPTLRMGLGERLFVDASVPYLYRSSNFTSGGAGGAAGELVEHTVRSHGLGDVSVGAGYRLLRESGAWPDTVINLRAKFPTGRHPYGIEFVEVANSEGNLQVPAALATGSGVYGASAGVSLLKTLDPMVVFGNFTYFYNIPRNFSDFDETPGDQPGRVNVGNAIQLGAGLAYALNERSSISMSYSQRLIERTRIRREGGEWRPIIGSQGNVALVNLGATFSLTDAFSLVGSVGIGLTDDSPDMSVNIRIPYQF